MIFIVFFFLGGWKRLRTEAMHLIIHKKICKVKKCQVLPNPKKKKVI